MPETKSYIAFTCPDSKDTGSVHPYPGKITYSNTRMVSWADVDEMVRALLMAAHEAFGSPDATATGEGGQANG